ncbi:hypothetical protein BZG36_03533 [Bifiguratus adelaidae]|uniref:VWFA domain-containing protein n=1 Tax=Bifiguratus adelaidae TaxID=1938954 RepID=A0A261XZ83_9FUNG|nr:hypothetical protein BZG36_03533 [Bifiguratus adelaidae]
MAAEKGACSGYPPQVPDQSHSPPTRLGENEECPVCHVSLFRLESEKAKKHAKLTSACIESHFNESTSPKANVASGYNHALAPKSIKAPQTSNIPLSDKRDTVPSQSSDVRSLVIGQGASVQNQEDRKVGSLRRLFSAFRGYSKTNADKIQERLANAEALMRRRWGTPESPVYEMAMRYHLATRMKEHWQYLAEYHPRTFQRYLSRGYMEPIPTLWVQTRELAYLYPEGSYWETPAEKRLYYLLNNGRTPDGATHPRLRPLNINRDRDAIIRRSNERMARQQRLDAKKLVRYQSPGDIFRSDKQIRSHQYSDQVRNVIYEARQRALHELADAIIQGTDHLETMLLIDVSGSMTWNPHRGIQGPDGITRYHDQPSNIRLVEHLVHRTLHHMIPRAQREHPNQSGIDTVTFSNTGTYIGQLTTANFNHDWRTKVRLGGGTQVMQGWQVVKNTYFQHQHATAGHGRFDPVFGWQPTPGMPKLSLLIFLDGEATDMDEFELELLGETWAYVTIALVGMENCPHHHSHAIELERVAKFNPHVGFLDVHGRVCERMVVEDLMSSVYPVDPPQYDEILKPEYDLPAEELPAYTAY